MNNLQLKATRQALGLTVADAAELAGVSKRAFQYWEGGSRQIPDDVDNQFFVMTSHYNMVLQQMIIDVEANTIRPSDDEIKPTKKPILPFFITFELFKEATNCTHVVYWRIYQSVISQLLLTGKITKLDDKAIIPENFKVWQWLNGEYEHQ